MRVTRGRILFISAGACVGRDGARQFVRVDEDEEERAVATRQVEMTSNAPAATVDARDLLRRGGASVSPAGDVD